MFGSFEVQLIPQLKRKIDVQSHQHSDVGFACLSPTPPTTFALSVARLALSFSTHVSLSFPHLLLLPIVPWLL